MCDFVILIQFLGKILLDSCSQLFQLREGSHRWAWFWAPSGHYWAPPFHWLGTIVQLFRWCTHADGNSLIKLLLVTLAWRMMALSQLPFVTPATFFYPGASQTFHVHCEPHMSHQSWKRSFFKFPVHMFLDHSWCWNVNKALWAWIFVLTQYYLGYFKPQSAITGRNGLSEIVDLYHSYSQLQMALGSLNRNRIYWKKTNLLRNYNLLWINCAARTHAWSVQSAFLYIAQ